MLFIVSLLLTITVSVLFYLKLVVPLLYWQKRDIFYLKPWTRFKDVFLSEKSFAEAVCCIYNQYPEKR